MPNTMRTPAANILRELPERDREWAARGDQFAGSADERCYGAELLGRAIGHAAELEAAELAAFLRALAVTCGSADTPADIAAAADVGRWQAYATMAAAMRPAMASFSPSQRLTVAATAYPLAGL
jgi:hypothetical protein